MSHAAPYVAVRDTPELVISTPQAFTLNADGSPTLLVGAFRPGVYKLVGSVATSRYGLDGTVGMHDSHSDDHSGTSLAAAATAYVTIGRDDASLWAAQDVAANGAVVTVTKLSVNTNTKTCDLGSGNSGVRLTSVIAGDVDYRVRIVQGVGTSQGFTCTLSTHDITIQLPTDGADAAVAKTAAQLKTLWDATAGALALATCAQLGTGAGNVAVQGYTGFTSGAAE